MATVRIYYSRADQDYSNWNLYLCPGWFSGDVELNAGKLFPDFTETELGIYAVDYPRVKKDFTVEQGLGYVDIETNNAKNFGVFIKRTDYQHDYDWNDQGGMPVNVCYYRNQVGYFWHIETAASSNFYIKDNSKLVYKDNTYTTILPQRITFKYDTNQEDYDAIAITNNNVNDDDSGNLILNEHKLLRNNFQCIVDIDTDQGYDIDIPDSYHKVHQTLTESSTELSFDDIYMLYLKSKTFDIGENMQLSIDQAALDEAKASAVKDLESSIAGCLYKLAEDIDAFDAAAFLSDFDNWKANKSVTQSGTVDSLKVYIEAKNALD
tara:strand:- start:9466 stop:10431 length:966 start_codon:yes stop_codon:yes gene_type:complete